MKTCLMGIYCSRPIYAKQISIITILYHDRKNYNNKKKHSYIYVYRNRNGNGFKIGNFHKLIYVIKTNKCLNVNLTYTIIIIIIY